MVSKPSECASVPHAAANFVMCGKSDRWGDRRSSVYLGCKASKRKKPVTEDLAGGIIPAVSSGGTIVKTGRKRLGLVLAIAVTAVFANNAVWAQPVTEVNKCLEAKRKKIVLVNNQSSAADVFINFSDISAINATNLAGFCDSTSPPLNCHLKLAGNSSKVLPNPDFKYVNMALAFNSQVTCGATKAEVIANNPAWCDIEDVSVVDGFNNKIEIDAIGAGGGTERLGPPNGVSGNQNLFGVYPFACTQCAAILNAPCGTNGVGECHPGTESAPIPPCQYQMESPDGKIQIILQP